MGMEGIFHNAVELYVVVDEGQELMEGEQQENWVATFAEPNLAGVVTNFLPLPTGRHFEIRPV